MQKRGIILLTAVAIAVLCIVLINAAPTDYGCCTTPGHTNVCEWITESGCCDNNSDCIATNFHKNIDCAADPLKDLCGYFVTACCKDTCYPTHYKANCPAAFENRSCTEVPECKEGCCICRSGTANACYFIESKRCSEQCAAVGSFVTFDAAITTPDACQAGCQVYVPQPANISGYVFDQQHNKVQGATVIIQAKTTQTDGNGFYRITDIPAGTNLQITASKGTATNISFITLLPQQELHYDITLVPAQLVTISGFVFDETKSPLPSATVLIGTYSTTTNSQGSYTINVPAGTYSASASKSFYRTESKTIDAFYSIQVNFTLIKLTGIFGYVTEHEAYIKQPVPANIYINNILHAKASPSTGYYTITDIAPGTYNLSAIHSDYVPYTATVNVAAEPIQHNISMIPIHKECVEQTAAAKAFAAMHVRGKKEVALAWNSPCEYARGFTISRTEAGPLGKTQLAYIQVINPKQISYIYTDQSPELKWGNTYTYEIIVEYDWNKQSAPALAAITLGDATCENKWNDANQRFVEFCEGTQRKTCNNENKVILVSTPPSDCAVLGNYFCAGPDWTGFTYCKNIGACEPESQQANPFGLYYKLLGIPSCYGSSDLSKPSQNYCFYDYTSTIIDKCYPCTAVSSCFDYKSELACKLDNQTCMKGSGKGCAWQSSGFLEFGKGFCYEPNYNKTDKCNLCSKKSEIFKNLGCTPEICSKLGRCFATEAAGCRACEAATRCEDFTTQQECTAGASFAISCGAHISRSKDICGIGICAWNGTHCIKDGNADGMQDCTSTACQQDTKPPKTIPPQEKILLNAQATVVITFTSDSDAQTLYYCIDAENQCCPDASAEFISGTNKATINPMQYKNAAWYKNKDATYYIRFYSIDKNKNQENIQSIQFKADREAPEIKITSSKEGTEFFVDVTVNEIAHCKDTFIGLNIPSKINTTGTTFSTNYTLSPDRYTYQITCTDTAGNSATQELIVDMGNPLIKILYPPYALKETSFAFRVQTNITSDRCILLQNNTKIEDFTTTDKILHTTKIYAFENNKRYIEYAVQCIGIGDPSPLSFTIDNTAPATKITIKNQNKEETITTGNWKTFFENEATISFKCEDYPNPPYGGFGCDKILMCISNTTCEPTATAQTAQIKSTSTICYKSIDKGGNQEPTKCGTLRIDTPLDISLTNPPYGESNTPVFDLIIKTDRATESCKISLEKIGDFFNLITDPKYTFEKISDTQHQIRNFPMIFPTMNFTAMPTKSIYIQCKETAGNISPVIQINLKYDPSPPIIKSLYFNPNPVLWGIETVLTAITDDATICEYRNARSGKFIGYDEADFKTENYAQIPVSAADDKKTFNYTTICTNKAGNSSEGTATFSVDFSAPKRIISTSPTGIIGTAQPQLKVETNAPATCKYTFDTLKEFTTQTPTTYIATETFTEGKKSIPVVCTFYDATQATSQIKFTVDLTPPIITSIDDGTYMCTNKLQPKFIANDSFSKIVLYNYTLFDSNGTSIINWTSTTSNNPSIKNIPLEIGITYFLKVMAQDEAGWWSNITSSDGFTAKDPKSTECTDTTPPTVKLIKQPAAGGISVAINCTDDSSGCDSIYTGSAATTAACTPNIKYENPIVFNTAEYLCYKAFDLAGNFRTGSEKITLAIDDKDQDTIPDANDVCDSTPSSEIDRVIKESASPWYGCGPSEIDTDHDGMPDWWENLNLLDPNSNDCTLDPDKDDLTNCQEYERGTDPQQANIADSDFDGVIDSDDKCPNTPYGEPTDELGCSLSQRDSDADGMPDAWEHRYGLNPQDQADAQKDKDNDGLANIKEYNYHTNPILVDTDGDGWTDKEEIDLGYNPIDPASHPPKSRFLPLLLLLFGLALVLGGLGYLIYIRYIKEKPVFFKSKQVPQIQKPVVLAPRMIPKPVPAQAEKERTTLAAARWKAKLAERLAARKKIFEAFAPKKPIEEVLAKPEFKKISESVTIPEKKDEFEKLAKIVEEHITMKKPIEPALKIAKVPSHKKSEFEKLRNLIKERIPGRPEEVKPEHRKEIKDIFKKLRELKRKVREKEK